MYHVNIFAAADKYDVPSLRVLVVSRFTQLMEQKWSTSQQSQQEFCTVIQCLCGLNAVRLADTSLQKAASAFCSTNILCLVHIDAFLRMLEECGPFAAHLLSAFLKNKRVMHTLKCRKCILASENRHQQPVLGRCCSGCGARPSTNMLGVAEKLQSYSIMEL
jgi:hypothetical protein